jgi:Protein of unknown function (DUF3072)
MSKKTQSERRTAPPSNTIKERDEWTTGDEPMTGVQGTYLHTLASEAGDQIEPELTKAEASKRTDALQEKPGRGQGGRCRPA